jgi:hypothetical protein
MTVKIAYIAGLPRSGSTILGNVLGQLPGWLYAGELHHFWGRGVLDNSVCGCGAVFHDCDVWRAVWRAVADGRGDLALEQMRRVKSRHMRTRQMPLLVARRANSALRAAPALAAYRDSVHSLYGAIRARTGCDVIVDSSKSPAYGYLLSGFDDFDVHVVHLVRDPRANCHVWLRRHARDRQFRGGLVSAASVWNMWHLASEMLWRDQPARYLRVTYEAFTRAPRAVIDDISAFLGQRSAATEIFVGPTTVANRGNHAFSANRNRLSSGEIEIRPDRAWEASMGRRDRLLVTALTLPLLRHYGYPLSVTSRG